MKLFWFSMGSMGLLYCFVMWGVFIYTNLQGGEIANWDIIVLIVLTFTSCQLIYQNRKPF